MSKTRVLIPWFPGTNCHQETAYAFKQVGAFPEVVPLNSLLENRSALSDCDILALPGGFSFGDHIAAGRIAALYLVEWFGDQLRQIVYKGTPVIGICNGFQVLVQTGLLSGNGQIGNQTVALDYNQSARFEHWRNTEVVFHGDSPVWTNGLDGLTIKMPVAHGEGRVVAPQGLGAMSVMATYGSQEGVVDYPASPNGSPIAGLCNGPIAGLMPHPERAGDYGLALFESGVNSVR